MNSATVNTRHLSCSNLSVNNREVSSVSNRSKVFSFIQLQMDNQFTHFTFSKICCPSWSVIISSNSYSIWQDVWEEKQDKTKQNKPDVLLTKRDICSGGIFPYVAVFYVFFFTFCRPITFITTMSSNRIILFLCYFLIYIFWKFSSDVLTRR